MMTFSIHMLVRDGTEGVVNWEIVELGNERIEE